MPATAQRIDCFTVSYSGRVNQLVTRADIGAAFDPGKEPVPPLSEFLAIWDTGATNSVITERVVQRCGLKPIGRTVVHTAGGDHECLVYLVCIRLPNNVGFDQVRVTEAPMAGDVDVLIGMDVISMGDFAVTTSDGTTTFSFRHPSCRRLDFVEEANAQRAADARRQLAGVGRNDPCPCGSGRKYKNCCMRNH